MKHLYLALATAVLSLLGIDAVFPNRTSVSSPRSEATKHHQGLSQSTPTKIDGCTKWRYLKNSSTSNEDIWRHALSALKDPYAACTLLVVCGLHQEEENVCGPWMEGATNRCFPRTKAGQSVAVKCPETYLGVSYNTSGLITKFCLDNGKWAKKGASNCTPTEPISYCFYPVDIPELTPDADRRHKRECNKHLYQLSVIAMTGNTISLVAAITSFLLFWWLSNIRCRRNIIHWNLISSYILRITLSFFIKSPYFFTKQKRQENGVPCRMLMTLFMYGEATNYFWMFVEGLHLHMMVVSGYSHDRIPMKVYAAIGWGGPGILAILWIALKSILDNTGCWYTSISGKSFDYVFQAPIIVLLTLNLGILITVVSIIFTKLRPGYNISGGTGQNEKEKYVKATKAALFLFPLLGFTYLVFLISPSTKDAVLAFWYFNSFAQSFQGFLVCMIYCFGNNEVKKAREDKVRHWRMQSRWSCCWPKDGIGLSRSLSNASTNNTNLLNSRTKDGRELQPSHSTKSEYAAARMHNEGTSVDLASTAERAWCSRHVGEISAEAVELAPMNEVKSLRENESAI